MLNSKSSSPDSINTMLATVKLIPILSKNIIMSIWVSKQRDMNLKTINLLLYLYNEWNRVYQEYRIKEGFGAAELRANDFILSLVYTN